jgi:hypothetical protein
VLTSGTAGCNRWVAGLLCETPALASTGSVVSTIGAAFAGAWIATFPVSAGCDTSLIGWLKAAAVVVSTGSVVLTTGAALATARSVKPPVVSGAAACDKSTRSGGTGVTAPETQPPLPM